MAGGLVKTAIQKVGVGALIGDAVNVYGGISDYKRARQQGNSKAMSVAKSVGTFAFYEMMGPWGLAVAGCQGRNGRCAGRVGRKACRSR